MPRERQRFTGRRPAARSGRSRADAAGGDRSPDVQRHSPADPYACPAARPALAGVSPMADTPTSTCNIRTLSCGREYCSVRL